MDTNHLYIADMRYNNYNNLTVDIKDLIEKRGQYDTQLNENNMVKAVRSDIQLYWSDASTIEVSFAIFIFHDNIGTGYSRWEWHNI